MKNKYCVGCSEVDADTRKDNPGKDSSSCGGEGNGFGMCQYVLLFYQNYINDKTKSY